VTAPVVAVAMPTYNHAAFIEEAIGSVLAQTFEAWELVVVDDGSTDGTVEIARRSADPRITVLAREHRGLEGLRDAYRAALATSTAPLVAVLEGDDRWPAGKLARQVADFDDATVVLSYGAGWLIDERGCEYGLVEPSIPPAVRTNRPTGSIVPSLLGGNPILAPTVVVRRSALQAVGGFWQPEGVPYVDHPTWLLLAMEGPFAYQPEPVGSWRRHSAQWTTRAVESLVPTVPETAYVGLIATRYAWKTAVPVELPPPETLARQHTERAILNRWRLALLAGNRSTVSSRFVDLVRSGRPRLVGLALLGLAFWLAGSDLEWLQRRRHRVSWPSRRHRQGHLRQELSR
jgi:hypothetical protein